jgi:hypothetical protein
VTQAQRRFSSRSPRVLTLIAALYYRGTAQGQDLHRHALMTCLAFAYLQHLRLAGQRSMVLGKMLRRVPAPPPSPSLPAVRRAIMARLFVHLVTPIQCPHCRRKFRPPTRLQTAQVVTEAKPRARSCSIVERNEQKWQKGTVFSVARRDKLFEASNPARGLAPVTY